MQQELCASCVLNWKYERAEKNVNYVLANALQLNMPVCYDLLT